jgi:hypothetical protein
MLRPFLVRSLPGNRAASGNMPTRVRDAEDRALQAVDQRGDRGPEIEPPPVLRRSYASTDLQKPENVKQRGKARSRQCFLDHEPERPRIIDSLMGARTRSYGGRLPDQRRVDLQS